MSDIRFNRWLHQSGTGGVYQDSSGNIGIGTSVPRTALDIVGVISATSFTSRDDFIRLTGTNIKIGDTTTGASITSGTHNFFAGIGAGKSTTTGCRNNFFGQYAGLS